MTDRGPQQQHIGRVPGPCREVTVKTLRGVRLRSPLPGNAPRKGNMCSNGPWVYKIRRNALKCEVFVDGFVYSKNEG